MVRRCGPDAGKDRSEPGRHELQGGWQSSVLVFAGSRAADPRRVTETASWPERPRAARHGAARGDPQRPARAPRRQHPRAIFADRHGYGAGTGWKEPIRRVWRPAARSKTHRRAANPGRAGLKPAAGKIARPPFGFITIRGPQAHPRQAWTHASRA